MHTKQILSVLAISAAVAVFCFYNAPANPRSFLHIIDAAELEFADFIGTFGRSFGTKEEYEYRLAIFRENY